MKFPVPDLEEIFHPDLSWLAATMQDLLPVSKLANEQLGVAKS